MSSSLDFRSSWQWVFRYLYPHTRSSNHFSVISFIFDRTISWGKSKEIITVSQMIKGVFHKGGIIAPAMRLCRATIINCIKDLLCDKMIFREKSEGDTYYYSINFNWTPKMLKLPKKRQEHCTESKTLEQVILAGAKRSKESKDKRIKQFTTSGVFTFWKETVSAYYDSNALAGITTTESHIIFQYAKRWMSDCRKYDDFKVYAEWCIKNWLVIRKQSMKWMKDTSPITPRINFFVKFHDIYENAFIYKENLMRDVTAPVKRIRAVSIRKDKPTAKMQKGVFVTPPPIEGEGTFEEWK